MKSKTQISYLFLLLVLAFASCKKENEELVESPQLNEQPANNGNDTITLGNTTVLHPKLSNKNKAVFIWMINGQAAGTDSVFAFDPAERGDYKINFKATTPGGEVATEYNIHVYGKFENGFYIVNEGWYGHQTSSVGFYRYDTKVVEDSVFTKENPGKDFSPASSTLESGVMFNDRFYLISKVHGPMVVTDRYSLKEIARIPGQGANDWRSFVGITAGKGLLSAQTGIYPVDLNTLQTGTKIAGITSQIGDLMKAGNYIFALSASQGAVILNATTNAVEKTIPGVLIGFTRTPDGTVWAAGGTKIVKIDPVTLTIENIDVPFGINGHWIAWHPSSISASTKENAVFIAKNGSFSGATQIYKYIPGNTATLQSPFITLPAGQELYGSGVAYDQKLNQVVVNAVKSGFGDNYKINSMYFYDAVNGNLKSTYSYEGFYFPAIVVPQQ